MNIWDPLFKMENLNEFIGNHWILVLTFAVLSSLLISQILRGGASNAISSSQATQLINQHKGRFIDVRDHSEFSQGHIAESKNIPLSELPDKIKKIRGPDKPVILVCTSGQRAQTAATQFQESGFTEVYVLKGGIQGWKIEQLPLFS